MTRIAVLDDWQSVARASADWAPVMARAQVEFFHAPFADEDEVARTLAPFEIVCTVRERTPFPASLAQRLPSLRMLNMTGAKAALIDVAALRARGVVVCHTGGGPSGASTAEVALALMLAAARGIPAADAAVRAGHFQEDTRAGPVLAGKTLGVIGLGRIGARVARYGQALEMRVVAWSQHLTPEAAAAAGCALVSKMELLGQSDVVSLHLVLSERTRGILGAPELARMKRGAILVNTARAALVDEVALIDAVQSKRIVAALDVFHREPLPATHPFARADNAVLTPHLGYSALEVYAEYYRHTVENVLAFLGGKPIRVADPTGH